MFLYRPTIWFRSTLSEKGVLVLGPEENAPKNSHRWVVLLINASPDVEFALDVSPSSAGSRDAYWARPPTNKTFSLRLCPEQTIVGRTIDGLHELSVVVEYHCNEHGGILQ